ncbi:MAG: ABC transporter permease [Flammeovirgaceae bacterium]
MSSIFTFELKTWLRKPLPYIFFISLWGLAFLVTAIPQLPIGNSTGNTLINAPIIISKTILILSAVGMLMIAAIASASVINDYESGFSKIYYSLPFSKSQYFFGKYLSAYAVLVLVFLAIPIGVFSASYMPWLNSTQLGAFQFWHYLHPILLWLLPSLFFFGSLFYALACLFRNAQVVYVGGILCYVLYLISYFSISRFSDFSVAAILDPFGILTEEYVSNYWTIEQQNTLVVPFSGAVLQNRLMYGLIGAIVLGISFYRFRLKDFASNLGKRKQVTVVKTMKPSFQFMQELPASNPHVLSLKQLFARSFFEFKLTVANRFFLIILFAAFLLILLTNWSLYAQFGVPIAKHTAAMIEAKEGPFPLFMLLILVVYAGDLVHRDRKYKFAGINDALPISNELLLGAKLLNLFYITSLMFFAIIVAGVLVQLMDGFYHIDFGLYLMDNFLFSLPIYFFFAIIIFILHIVAPNEYIGHALVLIFWLVRGALFSLGYEDHLVHYGRLPEHFYSEINGFFPFSQTTAWFFVYWLCPTILFISIALRLWKRGDRMNLLERFRKANHKMSRWGLVGIGLLWLLVGSFLYYQTVVVNDSLSKLELTGLMEAKKEQYEGVSTTVQPEVTRVKIQAKHFPESRKHEFELAYTLRNDYESAIDTIIINLPPKDAYDFEIEANASLFQLVDANEQLGVYFLKLANSLQADEAITINMTMNHRVLAFNDLAFKHQLLPNQSYFSMEDFPKIGFGNSFLNTVYQVDCQVSTAYQLATSFPSKETKLSEAIKNIHFGGKGAAAVGWYVMKEHEQLEFQEGDFSGRVFFQTDYAQNAKIALAAVQRVYRTFQQYDLRYPSNTLSIVQQARGYKNSLNTHIGLIGIDEVFGWLMNDLTEENFDYFSFYIAREIMKSHLNYHLSKERQAHHPFLVDALAEYFAYDFIHQQHIPVKPYLKRRHNGYLSQRPAVKDENTQRISASHHAAKGFFALVGLANHMGQESFNELFYDFIQQLSNGGLTKDQFEHFFELVTEKMPKASSYYPELAMKKVLFYDNRIESAEVEAQGDQFISRIQVNHKLIEGEVSREQAEVYEIQLLNQDGKMIKTVKSALHSGLNTVEVISTEKPTIIELDPQYTVMDLNRNNNRLVHY